MRKSFLKFGERLVHYSNHVWYGPFIGFLAAIDAYIFFISIEAILFPSVWAHPKKWFSTGLWLTIGSALGATSFAYLTSLYGEPIVRHFSPHLLDSSQWASMVTFISSHGALGLGVVSFSPLPQHAAVAIAGLAHMNSGLVFAAILLGRGLKYLPLAWAATHAPKLLKKLRLIP